MNSQFIIDKIPSTSDLPNLCKHLKTQVFMFRDTSYIMNVRSGWRHHDSQVSSTISIFLFLIEGVWTHSYWALQNNIAILFFILFWCWHFFKNTRRRLRCGSISGSLISSCLRAFVHASAYSKPETPSQWKKQAPWKRRAPATNSELSNELLFHCSQGSISSSEQDMNIFRFAVIWFVFPETAGPNIIRRAFIAFFRIICNTHQLRQRFRTQNTSSSNNVWNVYSNCCFLSEKSAREEVCQGGLGKGDTSSLSLGRALFYTCVWGHPFLHGKSKCWMQNVSEAKPRTDFLRNHVQKQYKTQSACRLRKRVGCMQALTLERPKKLKMKSQTHTDSKNMFLQKMRQTKTHDPTNVSEYVISFVFNHWEPPRCIIGTPSRFSRLVPEVGSSTKCTSKSDPEGPQKSTN